MQEITIGHDSEFGLLQDTLLVSALDVLEHYEDDNGRIFPDNMNCEIAINPVTTLKEFHSKTEGLLNYARDKGFDLAMKPVLHYPDSCLENPDALISGCNPDMSAYLMRDNIAPDFLEMDGTRSCGAHVHAGVEGLDPFHFSKWMDATVGLPLMMREEPNDRRKMYGGAGCLRVKDYGAEYRTLSNVWVDDPALREFVWEGTHKAIQLSMHQDFGLIENWHEIPQAIDTHDVELARVTLDRLYIYGVTNI